MRNGFSWGDNDQKLEQKQQITLFDVTEILLGDDPDGMYTNCFCCCVLENPRDETWNLFVYMYLSPFP